MSWYVMFFYCILVLWMSGRLLPGSRLFSHSYLAASGRYSFCREVVIVPKLTPKQQRFVEEYLVDLNATQAAIRAGYSERTANVQGAQILTKLSIQSEIQRLKCERSARTQVTGDRVIQELASIAFADIDDFARVGEHISERGIAYTTVELAQTSSLPPEKRAAIVGIKQGANGIEIKLADKVRALELLGKHTGVLVDRMQAEIASVPKIVDDIPDGDPDE